MEASVHDPLLQLRRSSALKTEISSTYGWYITLGTVSGSGGELQIWLDHFTRAAAGPQVSASFMVKKDAERIRAIATEGVAALGKAPVLHDNHWERTSGGEDQMRTPLANSMYRRPLAELYEENGSWKFYTMYWPDRIQVSGHVNQKLALKVADFFSGVIRSIAGVMAKDVDRPYPGFKNRARVVQHLRRERSPALARKARIRDNFTCTVCHINCADLYGQLGRGFAEVHHRIPLASKHAPKITYVSDLVTVCANCHRMLHRMPGRATDLKRLKAMFTGRWPKS